jgi:predicted RNA-binding Zn-ribbon protein involved in translation (DUF1610 family)
MRRYPFINKDFLKKNQKLIKYAGFFTGFAVLFLVVFIFIPELMFARPGGGNSYSGGGSSGGGSGDGIAGLIIWLILQLPPQISIPLIILIVVFYYIKGKKEHKGTQTVSSAPTYVNKSNGSSRVENSIEALKTSDPNFSRLLFLDFVSSLYHKYYSFMGKKQLTDVRPFFAENIWNAAASTSSAQQSISEIVIGNISFISVFENEEYAGITVDIHANYTLTSAGKSSRYIVTERWMFMRKRGVSSLAPEGMRDLKCPNCGAAGNFTDAGKCEYCDTFIQAGEMQWAVNQMTVIHQEVFSTKGLAHYEQEVGTDYPTIVQPAINTYINRFTELHKLPAWNTYWNNFTDNIAVAYFNEIYAAWSSLKWEKVRHLVSDRLYESYGFWIEAYKKENLQNKLDNISISRIDMAAIEVDKYYESFTVRIFASCLDYVENSKGKVLGGSKKSPRYFSEYWTFMRRAGVEIVESEFSLNNCPNCGAAADKMGQTAVCEYCGTKISNGDFSWILTRIVQDEEYTG